MWSGGGRSLIVGWVDTYLLAQIRAASRASDDNCSYSFDIIWMQSGNSSTLARLRPRSKMRILGSGTPRLKRDLGYGYGFEMVSDTLCTVLRVKYDVQDFDEQSHNDAESSPEGKQQSYLILAVAIAACWSSCHPEIPSI